MDTTYRLRYLLYFAAFMLVMSVCFVYAEPVTPQRASFSATAPQMPSFDPSALRAAAAPTVSPALMQQLEMTAHTRRGLLHRGRRSLALPAASGFSSGSATLTEQLVSPAPARETLSHP